MTVPYTIPWERQIHTRVYISRPDGVTWEDVRPHTKSISVSSGNVTRFGGRIAGIDGTATHLDLVLHNSQNAKFNPQLQTSPWNRFNGEYAPLLDALREIQIISAVTAPGETPTDDDWIGLFHGEIGDNVQVTGAEVTLSCRSLLLRLMEAYIENPKEYGSEAGVPLETVMQQIIDDNLGAGQVEIYCPEPTGFMIEPYAAENLQYKTVWDVLQNLASAHDFYLGDKWDPVTKRIRLTLLVPPRDKGAATADFVFNYRSDFYKEERDIRHTNIRNVIIGHYWDKAANEKRTITVKDDASISRYRRRAMEIEESATSLISTESEMLALLNGVLADLKDPQGNVHLDLPFFPQIDLFSGVVVHNPGISSTDDFMGVESYSHNLDFVGNKYRTELTGSGKIKGGQQKWLKVETRPGSPGQPSAPPTSNVPPANVTWGDCTFITDIELNWQPVSGAVLYEIRGEDASWGSNEGRLYLGNALTHKMTPTQRTHVFYIKAINGAGLYSEVASTVTVSLPAPQAPSQPMLESYFSTIKIKAAPLNNPAVQGYTLHVTKDGVTEQIPAQAGGTISYPAESGTTISVQVSAYDVIGEGAKSEPLQATTTALQDRDIPDDIITESKLQGSIKEKIDLGVTQSSTALSQISDLDGVVDGALTEIGNNRTRLISAEGEISSAKSRLDEAESSLSIIDGKLTTQETKITNIEGELSSKVSQTDFDTLSGTVSSHGTTLTQHASAIEAKAEKSEVDTIEGRVTTAEGQISTQAGQIALKANASDVYTKSEVNTELGKKVNTTTYNQKIGELDVSIDGISGRVSNTETQIIDLEGEVIAEVERLDGKIDVLPGLIELKADASIVDEQGTRITTAEQNISALDGVITQTVARVDQSAILKPQGGKLWHFDTSLESTDGIKPLEGAVVTLRPNEGRFGGAVAVEGGTENLIPSHMLKFEGWIAYQSTSVTVEQGHSIPGITPDGATRIQTSGGTHVIKYFTSVGTGGAGTPASYRVWVRNIGDKPVRVYGNVMGRPNIVYPGETKLCTGSTGAVDGTTHRQIQFQASDVNDSLDFIAYQPQIEEKPFATSFVDGSRNAGVLTYPPGITNRRECTIVLWVRVDYSKTSLYHHVLTIGSGTTERLWWWYREDQGNWTITTGIGGSSSSFAWASKGDVPEGWRMFSISWNPDQMNLYVDDENVFTVNNPKLSEALDNAELQVGHWSGSRPLNMLIDELLILPYAATEEEIKGWYEAKKPFLDQDEINYHGSQMALLADQWTVKLNADGNVAGVGLAFDDNNTSEFAVVADKFSVATPTSTQNVFTIVEGKAYLNGDLHATGSILAEHLEADAIRTLLLEAQLARLDELDALVLRGDKLYIGDNINVANGRIAVERYKATTQKIMVTEDTYTESGKPYYNNSSDSGLRMTNRTYIGGRDIWMKMSLPDTLRSVESVTLNLRQSADILYAFQLHVGAPNQTWDYKQITWDNAPAEFSKIKVIDVTSSSEYWISIDITEYVQGWLSGELDNNGLVLRDIRDDDALDILFRSSRYEDINLRPYIAVVGQFEGGELEEITAFGEVGGKLWGNSPLPAGSYGFWGEQSGIFMRGYPRLIAASTALDEQVIDLSQYPNLADPTVFVTPKELVTQAGGTGTISMYVDALKDPNDPNKYRLQAKSIIRSQIEQLGSRAFATSGWELILPTGLTNGKRGVETDAFTCRPMWEIYATGMVIGTPPIDYPAKLWMDITNQFNSSGQPINWQTVREETFNRFGDGVLEWDMTLPSKDIWAMRIRGQGGYQSYDSMFGVVDVYSRTGLQSAGYRMGDVYLDSTGKEIAEPNPSRYPSGMSLWYMVFDIG